ncbi:MAG: ABC-F family ATP-binding cassette domain-containing protein [Actinomycetota bacterium]
MITVSGLQKAFGPRDLFRDADLQVGARDRVAIVGPNGAGKTTLFEILAGEQTPDGGTIRVVKDAVVGYLRQETDALRGRTLLEEVLSAASELTASAHRLVVLEHEMADLPPGEERDRLVTEYGRLQDRFTTLGGYTHESEAKKILSGLGFKEEDFGRQTDTFSGGWLMRIALAKLLLQGPDVLMLDEPTNHLDLESVEWLERFLSVYEGAVLLISHDRDLINGVSTKVVEIDEAQLVAYQGNYADFVRLRAAAAEQKVAAAKHQARKRAETQAFIDRFRYKATKARQVQSRVKSLEKLEAIDTPKERRRKMNLRFPTPPRSGRVVLELDGVAFGYGQHLVYEDLDVVVERGQKIALVGPNGAGKTTLLKLLAGVLEPLKGERRLGHNAALGYFAQHQIEALDDRNRVLEELASAIPPDVDMRPRDLLGRFMFSGDDVDKPVGVLSGGERTRLALAKLLVAPYNVLCLDEPTNHLDIASRDVLEDSLLDYEGALILITHDRHLIRSVADRIIEVVHGEVTAFETGYDDYLVKRERDAQSEAAASERAAPPPEVPARPTGRKTKEQRRAEAEERARTKSLRDGVARIEKELDEVTKESDRISAVLADPGVYEGGADVKELVLEYERLRNRAKRLESRWDEATRALEEADNAPVGR